MTLKDSLDWAIQQWKIIGHDRKLAFLESEAVRDAVPSGAEEECLRTILDAQFIPAREWGGLCVYAARHRKYKAESSLKDEAEEQIGRAERFLDLTADDFLHWPWPALDNAIGGMAPGTLHYIVCPSKGGKTTLCRSAVAEWCRAGQRILYGGFEMKAETLRTMFAADDCSMDPGDVLTGAWLTFDHYAELKVRMADAYRQQRRAGHWYENLRFTSFESVGPKEVQEMMGVAHQWGADAVIIDHVDHIGGGPGKSEFSTSVATNHDLLELTQRHDLKTIITSQTNQTGKSLDRFRDHKGLRDEVVRFGDVKKQVATTMMSLYRPLKIGMTKEEREMVEYGLRPLSDFLLRGANAFGLMASRPYGSRIGMMGYLEWHKGRLMEPSAGMLQDIESAKHAIKTARE